MRFIIFTSVLCIYERISIWWCAHAHTHTPSIQFVCICTRIWYINNIAKCEDLLYYELERELGLFSNTYIVHIMHIYICVYLCELNLHATKNDAQASKFHRLKMHTYINTHTHYYLYYFISMRISFIHFPPTPTYTRKVVVVVTCYTCVTLKFLLSLLFSFFE